MDIEKLLKDSGFVWPRSELAHTFCKNDRQVRNEIRAARRRGVPIIALKTGGYKLAETDEEKKMLLDMYLTRAMDELYTYAALKRNMQIDGQTKMEAVIESVAKSSDK